MDLFGGHLNCIETTKMQLLFIDPDVMQKTRQNTKYILVLQRPENLKFCNNHIQEAFIVIV